ncbi:MAG TPA: hypothetical protein VGM14_18215 [Streptosporangiaceae bacterium]|jgi:hypothetical protein
MSSWPSGPGDSRYLRIPEIDRWRAVPFEMTPAPERGAVMQRVQQLIDSLAGALDEGSGAALDRLIESWTGSWIATVESDYLDHCATISVHRGQARQWWTEATVTAEYEREKLDECRSDLLASRRRLTGESLPPDPSSPDSRDSGSEPGSGSEADPPLVSATRRSAHRQDWSEPHLVAGRGRLSLIVGAFLILIGAMADTIAFHNTLELVLTTESAGVAWAMAVGTTSMALVAAGGLGVARAVRRRGRYLPPRHRPSRLPLILSSVVWFGLGLAMFVIRWLGQDANGSFHLSLAHASSSGSAHHTLWQAIFFAAIYLVSGTCTLIECERLYNPEYFAFQRLRKQYHELIKQVAKADAERDRAEAALEQHDGELQREDQRRMAAIADRQAIGAEAANYARVLMAAKLGDPSMTGITETGPVPELTAAFGARTVSTVAGAPDEDSGASAGGGGSGGGVTGAT